MRWSTHVAVGVDVAGAAIIAAQSGGMVRFAPESTGAILMGALLGSLLPDLDARESKIKYLRVGKFRPFYVLSEAAYRQFGHRGVLHSVLGLAMATTLAYIFGPILGLWCVLGISVGYFSHLLADSATVTGIAWLFPARQRYRLLPRGLRMVTGSLQEEVAFALTASLAIYCLLHIVGSG